MKLNCLHVSGNETLNLEVFAFPEEAKLYKDEVIVLINPSIWHERFRPTEQNANGCRCYTCMGECRKGSDRFHLGLNAFSRTTVRGCMFLSSVQYEGECRSISGIVVSST